MNLRALRAEAIAFAILGVALVIGGVLAHPASVALAFETLGGALVGVAIVLAVYVTWSFHVLRRSLS